MKQAETHDASGHWSDRFGALASAVCAVHCGVCALLPWAFGALGLGFLVGYEVEWALTLVAALKTDARTRFTNHDRVCSWLDEAAARFQSRDVLPLEAVVPV